MDQCTDCGGSGGRARAPYQLSLLCSCAGYCRSLNTRTRTVHPHWPTPHQYYRWNVYVFITAGLIYVCLGVRWAWRALGATTELIGIELLV